MYFLREQSSASEDPVFFKLPENRDGKAVLLFPDHSVAKWFYESGIAERTLINWVYESLISIDKVFVDIGAHVGTYTWTCATNAKHTYSFECSPKTFCYLAANVALHDLEYRVTLNSCALGSSQGRMRYYIRSSDGGGNGLKLLKDGDETLPYVNVEVKTLDSFHINDIGLIKIDVEGFEKDVLMGAVETLKRNNYPKILFESWGDWKESEGIPAKTIREELFAYINSLGYIIIPISGALDMYLAEYKL